MAKQTIEVVVQDKTARALGNINNRVNGLSKSFGGVSTAAKAFVAVLGAREIIQFGARIKDTTAEFQNYRNQLRLITEGQEDLNRVFNLLTQTAVANRTSFGETVDLFTKLRISTEALGIAEERVIDVTSKLSQALQVAGADGNTAASVIRQFGQAMASGEVRGDEFRSLVEGLGPALAIMARESGITVGQLRKMSQAGELTAEAMFALLENSKSLTAAFQSMDPTISQLETALSDAFDRALVKLGEVTGATSLYEDVIKQLTRGFDRFAGTEGALVNLELSELLKLVEEDASKSIDVLDELQSRLERLRFPPGSLVPVLIETQEIKNMRELIAQMEQLVIKTNEQAEAAKAATKAEQERIDTLNAIIKPYQEYINLGDKFIKQDFGTPLEKANAQFERAAKALEKLKEAQRKLDESDNQGFKDLSKQIEATAEAVAHYEKQVNDLSKSPYTEFLENVMEQTKEVRQSTQFTERAIGELGAQLEAGTIDITTYNTALKILRGEKKKTTDTTKELEDSVDSLNEKYSEFLGNSVILAEKAAQRDLEKYKEALDAKVISQEEFAAAELAIQKSLKEELLNLEKENQTKLDRIAMSGLMRRLKQEENFVFTAEDSKLLKRKVNEEKADKLANDQLENLKKYEENKVGFVISSLSDSMKALGEHNRKAFEASKALAVAEAIMNTYAMAVAAFKSLAVIPVVGPALGAAAAAAAIATGFAQVSAIKSQQYTGPREKGGPVGPNQSFLVGEKGPELFMPNAGGTIVPNNQLGSGEVNVNFNITTTDARGFDNLLVERRSTIVGIINQAMNTRGKTGVTV